MYQVKLARTKSKLAAISKCIYAEKIEANGDLSSNEKLRQSLLKNYSYYYDNDKLLKDALGGQIFVERDEQKKRVYTRSFGRDGKVGGGDDLFSYSEEISEE